MRGRLPKAFTYEGTGAAQSIEVGFRPVFLILINTEDGDTAALFIDGMADGTGVSTDAAMASIASNGITLTSNGFKLGTDAKANESAKTYYGVAF